MRRALSCWAALLLLTACAGRRAGGGEDLGTLRVLVAVHYTETEGAYPDAAALARLALEKTDRKKLPRLRLPGHGPQARIEEYGTSVYKKSQGRSVDLDPAQLRDTGAWGYEPRWGWVFIDCTHLDEKGEPWYKR